MVIELCFKKLPSGNESFCKIRLYQHWINMFHKLVWQISPAECERSKVNKINDFYLHLPPQEMYCWCLPWKSRVHDTHLWDVEFWLHCCDHATDVVPYSHSTILANSKFNTNVPYCTFLGMTFTASGQGCLPLHHYVCKKYNRDQYFLVLLGCLQWPLM